MTFLSHKTRIPQFLPSTTYVGKNSYLYNACVYPVSVNYWNTFMNTYAISTLPTVTDTSTSYNTYYNQIFNVPITANYTITYASDDLMTLIIDSTSLPQSDSITTAATNVSPYTATLSLTQGIHTISAIISNYRGGGTGFAFTITNSSTGALIYDTRTFALTCGTCGTDSTYTTNSLYFNLDAKNPASYSGSGTTWTDLTGNGHNFTLYNTPVWDSSGWFTFNGSNNYAITPPTSMTYTDFSLECWYQFNGGGMLAAWTNPYVSYINLVVDGNGYVRWETGYHQNYYTTSGMLYGNWYHILATYNRSTGAAKTYINGVIAGTGILSSTTSGTTNWAIGSNYNDGNGSMLNGKISIVRFYLKELTPAEVTQNYNAIKNRYCLLQPTTYNQLYTAGAGTYWGTSATFLNTNGVWFGPPVAASLYPNQWFTLNRSVTIPSNGTYTFRLSVDNRMMVYVDDVLIASLNDNYNSYTDYSVTLTAGTKTITIVARNDDNGATVWDNNPAAFALQILNGSGTVIYNLRDHLSS